MKQHQFHAGARHCARERGAWQPLFTGSTRCDRRALHGTVKRFVVECCVLDPDADVVAAELYRAFEHWAAATGKRLVMLAHNFEERLMAAGLKLHAGSTSRNARWTGIALKQAS